MTLSFFNALIFETSGRFDDVTKNLLTAIAYRRANNTAQQLTAGAIQRLAREVYRRMVQHLSCIMAHANGLMMKEAIMKASRPTYKTTSLYTGIQGRYRYG